MPDESKIEPNHVVALSADDDWLLQDIVSVFANNGVSIGLTLTMPGAVISGMVISGKSYFEKLAVSLGQANGNSNIIETMVRFAKSYQGIYEAPEGSEDDWVQPRTTYIHMENAYIFSPGQQPLPTNKGMLWRGKISAVSGFALGNLSKED